MGLALKGLTFVKSFLYTFYGFEHVLVWRIFVIVIPCSLIFSPTKVLEKSVVGGVTLNHLAWASLFGGNFFPFKTMLDQDKEEYFSKLFKNFENIANRRRLSSLVIFLHLRVMQNVFVIAFMFFSYSSYQLFWTNWQAFSYVSFIVALGACVHSRKVLVWKTFE